MFKIFVLGAMSLLGTGVALKVRAENDTDDSLAMLDMFDPLAKYYTQTDSQGHPVQALFEMPTDPVANRKHVFVIGPESCGTRLLTRIIGSDLGLHFHSHDYAHSDPDSTVLHVSLPWGRGCDPSRLPPEVSTAVVQYAGDGSIQQPIGRWNLHVDRLVDYYEQHAMAIDVFVIVRDPEISLASKIKAGHCFYRDMAIQEQARAYQLIMQSVGSPHVHVVCYEDLVSKPRETLASLRNVLGISTSNSYESIYNGNTGYNVPEPYPCTEMLRAYKQLCPSSALAVKYATC